MRGSVVPFVVALALFVLVFIGLDYGVMKMMGLALVYRP